MCLLRVLIGILFIFQLSCTMIAIRKQWTPIDAPQASTSECRAMDVQPLVVESLEGQVRVEPNFYDDVISAGVLIFPIIPTFFYGWFYSGPELSIKLFLPESMYKRISVKNVKLYLEPKRDEPIQVVLEKNSNFLLVKVNNQYFDQIDSFILEIEDSGKSSTSLSYRFKKASGWRWYSFVATDATTCFREKQSLSF